MNHRYQNCYVIIVPLRPQSNSVYVDGTINGKADASLVDIKATKTIVKHHVVDGQKKQLINSRWQRRTATGDDAATVYGEIDTRIGIGANIFSHCIWVTDIEEEIDLGIDIMT